MPITKMTQPFDQFGEHMTAYATLLVDSHTRCGDEAQQSWQHCDSFHHNQSKSDHFSLVEKLGAVQTLSLI